MPLAEQLDERRLEHLIHDEPTPTKGKDVKRGIISYGSYLPYHRLQRARIAEALGTGAGPGTRSVASYDEDVTSMGVEAARNAVAAAPAVTPDRLLFATAAPPYLDKNNASAIHAALRHPPSTMAIDTGSSLRSGMASLNLALDAAGTSLVIAADIRTGRPASTEEAGGGDAAAAYLVGNAEEAVAQVIGRGTVTAELMDRWRFPGETTASAWEDRFAASIYPKLAEQALTDAVKDAGVTLDGIDAFVVAGAHTRSVKAVSRLVPSEDALVDNLWGSVGNTGTAHAGLLLCHALDQAEPEQVIAVINLADGVDVMVLRTTAALPSRRPPRSVADWLTATDDSAVSYADFLTWRGFMTRQAPRRPDPAGPAAPPSARAIDWKFGFVAGRDNATGSINMPPQRVTYDGDGVDNSDPVPMADIKATVVTYTIDRLAYSLAPPVVMAVLDFDGGGRVQCELTDVDPDAVQVGTRVEMSFRRMFTADGIHNYFWKGRPIRQARTDS